MNWLRRPRISPDRYQADGALGVEHLDGVPWTRVPVPRRLHRCWPQSRWLGGVERCPCGGLRMGYRVWIERNSRAPGEAAGQERMDRADELIREYWDAAPGRRQEIRAEVAALLNREGP